MENLETIVSEATLLLDSTEDSVELENIKVHYLGKNGVLTGLLKQLGKIPVEQRPLVGSKINQAKNQLEEALKCRREVIYAKQLTTKLNEEALDVTLPGRGMRSGGLHPVTQTLQRIEKLFHSIGFDVAFGPEIETDFYNFTALNIPENHPARAMHDTFYIDNGSLLRTHTSPVQIHYMQNHQPPMKVIAPGRVYRCDSDVTHTPMFHQVEGLWVDEDVNFAALKSVLADFMTHFFERDNLSVRFRPSFFPLQNLQLKWTLLA